MAVLITGAATAGAHRLQRELQFDDVIFADYSDLPASLFKETKFITIPAGNSASFAHQILALSLDNKVEIIFPLRREELKPLAEARLLFDEYGIKVIVPDINDIDDMLIASTSVPSDFLIMFEGMVLAGQLMELTHLPGDTGLFAVRNDDPGSFSLFVTD